MKRMRMRLAALMLVMACLLGMMSGCAKPPVATEDIKKPSNATLTPVPLSGFEDITDENGYCAYEMVADLGDTYTFSCESAEALTVNVNDTTVEGTTKVQAAIEEGDTVLITVKAAASKKVAVQAQADNHLQRLPYLPNFTVDASKLSTTATGVEPEATTIEYKKREGGTYVYLNNPEKLQPADIGQAILRDEGLTGDVQVTWEHSNFTGTYVYLGYQLKNAGDTDVFVTVSNIGYQVQGEWLGQQSWSDYYNYKFELPSDYFNGTAVDERYLGQDFIDYTPRVFQPTTYRIPAGEYIWLVGGTSAGTFNDTNVADTANKMVFPGKCTNAVAKCTISGGEVTGTFYCYSDIEQVEAEPEEQGYITMRDGTQFGEQYKGVDYHTALIESNPIFYIDDKIKSGSSLPVTYDYEHAEKIWWGEKIPYAALDLETETRKGSSWATNISPHGRGSVGVDMSSFECVTPDGKTVTIDVNHRDGTGGAPNLGNWMIDYHDNMTFVNQGDRTRRVTINKSAQGALMAMIISPEGDVLSTKCTIVPIDGSSTSEQWSIYTFEIPPHSTVQLCASFLLMGNSYGNVSHWISIV